MKSDTSLKFKLPNIKLLIKSLNSSILETKPKSSFSLLSCLYFKRWRTGFNFSQTSHLFHEHLLFRSDVWPCILVRYLRVWNAHLLSTPQHWHWEPPLQTLKPTLHSGAQPGGLPPASPTKCKVNLCLLMHSSASYYTDSLRREFLHILTLGSALR